MRLKDASDAKLTVDGRSFHTFTSLSAKKSTPSSAVRPWFIQLSIIGHNICSPHARTSSYTVSKLECGTMLNVMAAQPNIGGVLCESSVIPFLLPRREVRLTPAARVPCSNAANIGEPKTWT